MRAAVLLALLLATACNGAGAGQQEAAKSPLPGAGPLPYIMREAMPAGDRLGAGRDGAALFSNRCGACHLAGGMGTNLLTKQRIAAGEPPESGMLANRTDLTADYVKGMVRGGKVAMPPLSRVEVTDAELDSIAAYLASHKDGGK